VIDGRLTAKHVACAVSESRSQRGFSESFICAPPSVVRRTTAAPKAQPKQKQRLFRLHPCAVVGRLARSLTSPENKPI